MNLEKPKVMYEDSFIAPIVCKMLQCDISKCTEKNPLMCPKHLELHGMCELMCDNAEEED